MEFGQVVYMEPCTLYIDFIILLSLSLSLSLQSFDPPGAL